MLTVPLVRHLPRVLLLLVLGLTIGLRWFRFNTFPPGLWYDEAFTLAEGQKLLQGEPLRLYYPEKHGEPAIFWFTAIALKLGAGHLAPRWVVSVSSVIGVLLLFFAVRDIMRQETEQAEWIALYSAAALGINYAYLFNSRMGWEALLGVPTFIATIWLLWRGIEGGSNRDFALAGLMAGWSQYTSVAARLLPLAVLLMLLGWLGENRYWWRNRWKGLLITGGIALATYLPLALAFLTHPEWFERRLLTAVSPSALLPNLARTLLGWLLIGEAGLHSLPGRPIYDPAMGFLLVTGLAVALWRIRRPTYNVWLAWFIGVLPGGFLSNPAPMFYRFVTAIPAAAALCAIGGWHIWYSVVACFQRLRLLVVLSLSGILIASTWATCHDYFVRWANWPRLSDVMDVWKWRAAETILNASTDESLFVTIPDGLEPAISYALHARRANPARAFDGARCLVYPNRATRPVHYVIVLGYEHRSLERLQLVFPSGYQSVDPLFGNRAPYFVNFFVPPGTEATVLGELASPVRYQAVALRGVYIPEPIVEPGDALTVTLTWESLEPTSSFYTVFVHLLDSGSDSAAHPLKAQHDSPPCNATEPTWRWRPGEYVLDEHILALPPDLLAGEYLLGVGLYDSLTLERVPPTTTDIPVHWGEPIVGSMQVVAR